MKFDWYIRKLIYIFNMPMEWSSIGKYAHQEIWENTQYSLADDGYKKALIKKCHRFNL